jgi:hypothetical protein
MRLPHALLLASLLLFPTACTRTLSLEAYPGLAAAPNAPTAVIEEDDHCLIDSVDDPASHRYESKASASLPLVGTTYHRFQLPAGHHTLYCIFQSKQGGWVQGNSHPVPLPVDLQPNHTYSLSCQAPGGAWRGPSVAGSFFFNPFLRDDATQSVVASAYPLQPANN